MSKSWNDFPPEILEIIFTDFDRQELFQYELVCQNWKSTAQRLAYAELEFYKLRNCKLDNVDNGGDDLVTRLKQWIASLQVSDQGPWIHVKKLNSGTIWDEVLESDTQLTYLDRFAELFPALEHLDIRNPDAAFYLKLVDLHKDGRWDNLKTTAEPRDNQSIPAYVECALDFSQSLTHLELADKIVSFGSMSGNDVFYTHEYDLLVNRIQNFTHLTSLKICKYNNRFGNPDLETFDSIIDNCKALTSAKYKIFNPRSNNNSTDNGNAIDLTLVEERPHISEVGISAMTLSDQALQYIMRKYPKLQSLSIIYTHSDICQYSTATLGRFFSFLCNIKDIQLASMAITPQTLQEALVQHFETTSATARTARTSTMDYNFRFYFGVNRDLQAPDVVKTTMRANRRDTIFMDLKYENRSIIQFVDTITRCGKYMDYLFLDFNHLYARGGIEAEFNWANGYMLNEIIFKHCTRLKKLYLNSYILDIFTGGTYINNTITRLDLDGCKLSDNALPMISCALPFLRDLNIERCEFDLLPEFLDIEMRCTRFDSLSIALWRTQNNIGAVRVKELAPRGESGELFSDKYYKSVHDSDSHDAETSFLKLTDSDINEYRALVRSGDCLNLIIECRALRQLDLYLHPE